jgi:hypothetical protein
MSDDYINDCISAAVRFGFDPSLWALVPPAPSGPIAQLRVGAVLQRDRQTGTWTVIPPVIAGAN